jgi:hypothetical protein
MDDLFPYIGQFGWYQRILFLLMIPYSFFFAFVYFAQIFMTVVPSEHWCYVPELANLTLQERSVMYSSVLILLLSSPISSEAKQERTSFSYPYPTKWGRYNMFFIIMIKIRQLLRPATCLTSTLLETRMLTTANAAGTNGLTCLPKHGIARDNKFLNTNIKVSCGVRHKIKE